jgi:hypothetical protein
MACLDEAAKDDLEGADKPVAGAAGDAAAKPRRMQA